MENRLSQFCFRFELFVILLLFSNFRKFAILNHLHKVRMNKLVREIPHQCISFDVDERSKGTICKKSSLGDKTLILFGHSTSSCLSSARPCCRSTNPCKLKDRLLELCCPLLKIICWSTGAVWQEAWEFLLNRKSSDFFVSSMLWSHPHFIEVKRFLGKEIRKVTTSR